MPPKVKELLAKLADEIAKDPAERDDKAIAAIAKDIQGYSDSDEGKGYAGTVELTAAVEQLRKDVDAQTEAVREAKRLGLSVHGLGVRVPSGRSARMQMLADSRCFMSDETAERFGAELAVKLFKVYARDVSDLPQRTREIAESVRKDADIDPSLSGSGAELVSNEFRAELIRNVEAVGQLYPLMRRVPLVTFGTTTYPKRTAGMTAHPTAVAAQIAQSGITFDTVQLQPEKWAVLSGIPNEMFRFANMLADIGQLAGLEIVYAMQYAFDNAVVNGDGTADYGGITGILESLNISAVTAASGHTTMATIDETDVSNVIAGLTKDYAIDKAAWGFSLSVQRALRNIRATTGVPLYDRGNGGEPNTIDGYPYSMCNRMPAKAAVTAGTKYGFFGDLEKSHYFGMVREIEIAKSEHIWFGSDMTAIRGIAHVDCQEADADAIVVAKSAAS